MASESFHSSSTRFGSNAQRAPSTRSFHSTPPSTCSLTRRLEEFVRLTDADRAELNRVCTQSTHTIVARRDLIREGDAPRSVYLILDGWACQYRTLVNGRRQIVDFAIPGDLCDLNIFILDRMDHSIGAITRLRVAEIGRDVLHRLVTTHPNIATAFWWQELVSKSVNREWVVNVGQRTAQERIAHLFCEMFLRLESVGLTAGFSCDFPLTQQEIAEATGLTVVHVNRTVQELRRAGLIVLERQKLAILDMLALQSLALFNPEYLHHRQLKLHTDEPGGGVMKAEGNEYPLGESGHEQRLLSGNISFEPRS